MKKITSLAFVCALAASALAQTKIPLYTVMHGIEVNSLSTLPGHAEWGFTELRRHIHSTMPSATAKEMTLRQPSTYAFTPQQLYQERHECALIFGKLFMCNRCPDLHVDLIATATPVTTDGICLTNYHMVHPIVSGDPKICTGDSVYFVADRDGQCYPVTDVLAYSREEDAAVIRVNTMGNELPAIPLGKPAETGQHINLISHPKKMIYTYTQGYVTRNATYNYPNYPVMDLMEISADFAEGSSGGPVMDDCGNLVAMVKGTTTIYYDDEKETKPQMVRKVTIPITTLRKLLKK